MVATVESAWFAASNARARLICAHSPQTAGTPEVSVSLARNSRIASANRRSASAMLPRASCQDWLAAPCTPPGVVDSYRASTAFAFPTSPARAYRSATDRSAARRGCDPDCVPRPHQDAARPPACGLATRCRDARARDCLPQDQRCPEPAASLEKSAPNCAARVGCPRSSASRISVHGSLQPGARIARPAHRFAKGAHRVDHASRVCQRYPRLPHEHMLFSRCAAPGHRVDQRLRRTSVAGPHEQVREKSGLRRRGLNWNETAAVPERTRVVARERV